MVFLLKRELYTSYTSIYFMLFFIPIVYVLDMSITFPAIFTLMYFAYGSFYVDHKFRMNRFVVSLPISKNAIVFARYTFVYTCLLIVLAYQWLVDFMAHLGLPYLSGAPIDSITFFLLMMGASIILALSLPIFYIFSSFTIAISVNITLFFLLAISFGILVSGTFLNVDRYILFIFDVIDIQPHVISSAVSLLALYLSYLLSVWIFKRKDIA